MHQRSECLVRTVKSQGPPARRQPSAALLDLDRGADMGLLPCHPGVRREDAHRCYLHYIPCPLTTKQLGR